MAEPSPPQVPPTARSADPEAATAGSPAARSSSGGQATLTDGFDTTPSAAVSLRPVAPDDMEFLSRVYASTREEELVATGWDDATKRAFLTQQFRAQHDYYVANYEGASYSVVLVDEDPAGRLYVARWPDQIRIMDISLLPQQRGRGIGQGLLRTLMDEAAAAGKPVTIHVEQQNPAMSLYRRLGFEDVEVRGVYVLMKWRPAPERAS